MKKLSGVSKLGVKTFFHFLANFKRALLDSRPNRGMNIFRARTKFHPHAAHAFFHDALHRPAPSGMEGAHSFYLCIDEQNWEAVGGENAQHDATQISHHAIAHKLFRFARANNMNDVRMNLAQRDQRPRLALRRGSRSEER